MAEPPTEAVVREFWQQLGGGEIPSGFLHLILTTGGMKSNEFTHEMTRLWNFDDMLQDGVNVKHGERYLYFADHHIGMWFLALRLSGDPAIYAIGLDDQVFQLTDSHEAFWGESSKSEAL